MKKIMAMIMGLLLTSGVFAKQYLYTITQKSVVVTVGSAVKIKDDLEKTLFDLILRGFEIIQVIPTEADGYTIGYTILYKDNK